MKVTAPEAPVRGRGARAAVFAQLDGAGRSEQVAQRLTDAILLGVLQAGEKLPSEAEMARRFGVAVVTAREGLSAIRDAGLVETRRGREGGSFVLASHRTPEVILRARLHGLSQVEIADVGAYFGAVTAGSVERAAELASDDEAQRLAAWLAGADFISEHNAGRNQGGFFLELAVISQSPRLVREQIRLQAEFGQLLWLGMSDAAVRDRVAVLNRRVVDAVASRDGQTARTLVRTEVGELAGWLLAAKEHIELRRPRP
ncbi:FadR/GntR family transcriptional regulator [Specibacter cremeus]|uniref:FadR/GntR family transcriptional regulator n=1 Tax=Specibacter cremeus TaxID=1629051 RepID=UPI000F7AF432|nr:GntR family transcriptional regulator [Specibacter cremeus]